MFGLNNNVRYYLCQRYIDMRNGINGLYKLIKSEMKRSPITGDVFVFFGKNRRTVKLLRWDSDGFILYQKRLEEGTFEVPRLNPETGSYELSWETFSLIMQGVSLRSVQIRKRYKIK